MTTVPDRLPKGAAGSIRDAGANKAPDLFEYLEANADPDGVVRQSIAEIGKGIGIDADHKVMERLSALLKLGRIHAQDGTNYPVIGPHPAVRAPVEAPKVEVSTVGPKPVETISQPPSWQWDGQRGYNSARQ